MPDRRAPFWLWPNLLSLDAPLVAVAWLFMFSRAWRVDFHPWHAYAALGLTVWIIYVADRLLDVRMSESDDPSLGLRHKFHAKYWKWFVAGVVLASAAVLWLAFKRLPGVVIGHWSPENGLKIGYSIPIIFLVGCFYILVIFVSSNSDIPYIRNILAGMIFGLGTALAAHVYLPMESFMEMVQSREVICFGVLCILNISAIHLWEHSRSSDDPDVREADEISLTLPLILLAASALWFAYQDNPGMFGGDVAEAESLTRPFFYGVLVSAGLLQVINRTRDRFSMDALRSLADLAMIVPLLFFIVFSGG
jgi:hypothetical protein